jgi:hypothetical protein
MRSKLALPVIVAASLVGRHDHDRVSPNATGAGSFQ